MSTELLVKLDIDLLQLLANTRNKYMVWLPHYQMTIYYDILIGEYIVEIPIIIIDEAWKELYMTIRAFAIKKEQSEKIVEILAKKDVELYKKIESVLWKNTETNTTLEEIATTLFKTVKKAVEKWLGS